MTNGAIADYFGTIIWPAAYTFAVGSSTQKYLEYSWTLGGVDGSAFTSVQGSVNAGSWIIQASAAVGLFWDAKAGAPLMGGIETKGNLMIGGTGGYSSTTTTSDTDQWGISLSPFGTSPPWGPPNWGALPSSQAAQLNPDWENSVIAHYKFALFFLPDPKANDPSGLKPSYWVQELLKYGNPNAATVNPNAYLPANLDPGSGCWKIVYVVLEIQTYADMNNDPPTYTYKYSDPDQRFS